MGPVKTSPAPQTLTRGRAMCVFAVRNLQEDRFKIHTSLLRSSKLTLFSANQEKAERRSYCSCVSSGEEEGRRAGGFFSAADWLTGHSAVSLI